ncbi:MAG: hypothetical protein EBU46_08080 [Nitrosomonadaceae bacterium]|nr:hypothetical protein [Nitrosomonadaceae bacterium]
MSMNYSRQYQCFSSKALKLETNEFCIWPGCMLMQAVKIIVNGILYKPSSSSWRKESNALMLDEFRKVLLRNSKR